MRTFKDLKKGDTIYLMGWDFQFVYKYQITGMRICKHVFGLYTKESGYNSFPIEVLNKAEYGSWFTDLQLVMQKVSTYEFPVYY